MVNLFFAEAAVGALSAVDGLPLRGADPGQSSATLTLLAAARDVLDLPNLAPEDSLPDHCRDVRKIIRIVRAVQARTGIELSITSFAQPRSIASIGSALAARRVSSPLLVSLRPGVGEPIFLIPGIAGAVVELIDLANAIDTLNPVYGLPYPGLDGQTAARESVLEIAQDLSHQIVPAFGSTRVHLIGYSSGGCVAIELARLLGPAAVGLVAVVDAPIHVRHWPLAVWVGHLVRRLSIVRVKARMSPPASDADARNARSNSTPPKPVQKPFSKVVARLRSILWSVHQRYGNDRKPDFLRTFLYRVANLPHNLQRVRDGAILGTARDRPQLYEEKVVYFCTEQGDALMCEPSKVWSAVLPNARFVRVPGGHSSVVIEPNVSVLGKAVSRSLAELDS